MSTLPLNEGAQGLTNQSALLTRSRQPLCLGEKIVVEGKCRAHGPLLFDVLIKSSIM